MQDCSSGVVDRLCTACDVNAVDSLNLTALDYCIYKGDNERADLMVKNGARMDPVLLLHTKCKRC
jgi:ankyrin repeat protein